jgi:hypothetical protein
LAGNHEDETNGDDGYIARYAACLPDRIGVTGIYAHQFWFDYPPPQSGAPLARFILIDANLHRDGERIEYCKDGEAENCAWLAARIDEAQAAGLWTIVGVHKNCFTIGDKPCEIGDELVTLLAEKKVDLVIQGHDHGYQRSKQVRLGDACPRLVKQEYNAACIVDDGAGNNYTRGAGMLWVISAVGGVEMYDIHTDDPEIGYLTRWMERQTQSTGFLQVGVSAQKLDAHFVATTGEFADAFTIESAP